MNDTPTHIPPPGASSGQDTTVRTVTREQWGAQPARAVTRRSLEQITEAYVHHAAPTSTDHDGCAAAVRTIQRYHQQHQGWADIGYHRIACPHGFVFLGRPLEAVGAHCQGHNEASIGYAALWHEDDSLPPQPALDAILEQIRADEATTGRRYAIKGHRDGFPTACPGAALYEWVQRIRDSAGPEPHPPPPAPTPSSGWRRVRVTGDLPLLHQGTAGEPVRVWQSILAAHNIFTGRFDGVFGPATAAGTRELQQKAHLATDAVVGPDTWLAGLQLNEGR